MKHNEEDIRGLMFEKLDNAIAPEDDLLLEQLIAEDKKVEHLWEEMQTLFTTGNGKRLLEMDMHEEWNSLRNKAQPARSRKVFRIVALIATSSAAVVFFLYLSIYWFNHSNRHSETSATAAAKAPKAILLQLEDGRTINLSDQSNTAITSGDTRLQNSDKTLSYAGGTGASTQWSTLTVPPGLDYKVMLSDSSVVWLNAATTIRFPLHFTDSSRDITVNGEAYIQVAHNAARPFIVHLPHATVQVLGTEFNINSYDSGIAKVALVKGKVNLQAGNDTRELRPGYEAASHTGTPIEIAPFDERQVLAWMKGQYVFSNASVQDLGRVLRRTYGLEVVIDRAEAGQKRFTGIINKYKKLTDFLDNLTTSAEISYYYDGAVLHFK